MALEEESEQLTLDNPLLRELAIRLTHWAPNECRFALDLEERHLNRQRSLHGGVIATMLDAACGYTGIYSESGELEKHAVTITLNINYLGKTRDGRIEATGRLIGQGTKIYFAAAELRGQNGQIIATAQGSFKRATPT